LTGRAGAIKALAVMGIAGTRASIKVADKDSVVVEVPDK